MARSAEPVEGEHLGYVLSQVGAALGETVALFAETF